MKGYGNSAQEGFGWQDLGSNDCAAYSLIGPYTGSILIVGFLLVLWLRFYIPVNSYGHVKTASSPI